MAPAERVLPLAISQRKAPIPIIGIANAEMRRRKPKIATSHGVEVVPKVAPTITPTACWKLTKPALTKPMTVSVVAVEDWLATVTRAPENHRAQSAGDEGLQGAAQRVAGKALQALGEVMDLRAERGRSRRRAKSRRRC